MPAGPETFTQVHRDGSRTDDPPLEATSGPLLREVAVRREEPFPGAPDA